MGRRWKGLQVRVKVAKEKRKQLPWKAKMAPSRLPAPKPPLPPAPQVPRQSLNALPLLYKQHPWLEPARQHRARRSAGHSSLLQCEYLDCIPPSQDPHHQHALCRAGHRGSCKSCTWEMAVVVEVLLNGQVNVKHMATGASHYVPLIECGRLRQAIVEQ